MKDNVCKPIPLMYFSTISMLMSKNSKDFPKLLSANIVISEVFSLVKTLVKDSLSTVAFFAPSVTVTPLLPTRFPTDSLVLVFDWT